MGKEAWQPKWEQLVAKSWGDEKLRDRLMTDTRTVLGEHGIDVPPGIQVKLVQDTSTLIHLTMSPRPSTGELSDEELGAVAGGLGGSTNPAVSFADPVALAGCKYEAPILPAVPPTPTKTKK